MLAAAISLLTQTLQRQCANRAPAGSAAEISVPVYHDTWRHTLRERVILIFRILHQTRLVM